MWDWPLWVDLVQGECASGGVSPGQPPGCTRHTVTIGPGEVEDSQNDQRLLKPRDCNNGKRQR